MADDGRNELNRMNWEDSRIEVRNEFRRTHMTSLIAEFRRQLSIKEYADRFIVIKTIALLPKATLKCFKFWLRRLGWHICDPRKFDAKDWEAVSRVDIEAFYARKRKRGVKRFVFVSPSKNTKRRLCD